MEEHSFKRKSKIWVLTLVLGLLAIYYGFNTSEMNYISARPKYIFGAITIVYAVWLFLTPFISIKDSKITVKKDILSVTTFEIDKIEDIKLTDDTIEIIQHKKKIKFKIGNIETNDQKDLVDIFKKIIENKSLSQIL